MSSFTERIEVVHKEMRDLADNYLSEGDKEYLFNLLEDIKDAADDIEDYL